MMRLPSSVPFVAIVLAVLALACPGQNEATTLPPSTPLTNADFENGTAGDAPPGWNVRAGETGKVVLDHTTAFAGEQCATITVGEDANADRLFTNLMQSIDAKPYQGKRVRFRAAVQAPGLPDDTLVQLWMRVDQPKGADGKSESSSFDNMSDRPIKNATWAHHDIVLDVAPDAARINCGIFVIGKGKAWIDDTSLSLVGDDVPTTPRKQEPAPPTTEPQATEPQPAKTPAQDAEGLKNGDFESDTVGEAPADWRFTSSSGATIRVDDDGPSAGERSVHIDATNLKGSGRKFTNLSQSFSAEPWQGKRVTFRAAVRVGDLTPGSTVNLWMRVDQPKDANGRAASSTFDNMGNRPIKNELWVHHEIVLDVKKDADRIIIGMFVIGEGKAWFDDATFAVAAEGKKTTGGAGSRGSRQRDPRVTKALAEAADAPQQPFWTWWLLLPTIAFGLFCFAMWPLRRIAAADKDAAPMAAKPSIARWFALDFTIIYWLLYCLPRPLGDVLGRLGSALRATDETEVLVPVANALSKTSGWMHQQMTGAKTWLTEHSSDLVFGIPSETLVPPNGSGDGTFSYIANFTMFVLAVLIAGGLCFLRRRPVRYEVLVDLMRTFLRFVLVFYLLSYGLAKTAIPPNQFGVLGESQLNRTWGDTAPMGVVWSLMGASEPYRIFGGICEVLPALLLVSRRTATLGALVSLTVMTNVAMLNYCYDIPVKLLSSHLVIMSIVVCIPDIVRLTQVFAGNRTTLAPGLPSVWTGTWQRWTRRIIKAIVIVVAVAMPIYNNISNTREHLAEQSKNGPPPESKHKLMKRGFRWINEVPYSR